MREISELPRRDGKILYLPWRRGMTETEIVRAQRLSGVLSSGWSVDRYEDPEGALCVVVLAPEEREDAPSFCLHAETDLIAAGMVVRDRYVLLGRHDRVEDAMYVIAAAMRGEYPLAA